MTSIIRIATPLQSTTTLRTEELWWPHLFQESVWRCRKVKTTFLKRLRQYGSSDVPKVHILKYPVVTSYVQGNKHSNITEDKFCNLSSGLKSTQWVARNDRTAETIAQWARGNLHVEIFAAVIQQEDPSS